MTFKIKDGIRIGTVDVFNSAGVLQVAAPSVVNALTIGAGLSGTSYNGSGAVTVAHSNTVTASTASEGGITRTLVAGGTFNIPSVTYDANGHITAKGSIALTLPASSVANNGTFAVSIGAAGATNTSLTWGTSTGFSADTASNITYDLKVGPALTALTTLMTTAGAGFIKRGAVADTYTIDTSTYLTGNQSITLSGDGSGTGTTAITLTLATVNSNIGTFNNVTVNAKGLVTAASNVAYLTAEADTLQTVTTRGATSNVATVSLTGGTASTLTTNGTLVVTGGVGISGALNIGGAAAVGGDLTITGNLTINGTTTTVNSTTLSVDDKNIELGSVAVPSNTTADGGGITLKGATDKTLSWINSTSAWTSSEHIALAAGKNIQVSGATSGTTTIQANATAGAGTLTLPTATGTLALTSDIITPSNGTFAVSIGTAGATNTTLTWGTSTGFSANTASNLTYDLKVGPAITALAALMTTAGAGFIKRGATADTYTIDTSTYLTANQSITLSGDISGTGTTAITATLATVNSNIGTFNNVTVNAKGLVTAASNVAYLTAESDTLQTVTTRGNVTTTDVQLNNSSLALAPATAAKIWKKAVTSTLAANTATAIDSWAVATYRSAKYYVQATQGAKFYSAEINVIHDGTTAYITEFAVLENTAMLWGATSWTATIATGTLSLAATITDATTTNVVFQIERTLFAV